MDGIWNRDTSKRLIIQCLVVLRDTFHDMPNVKRARPSHKRLLFFTFVACDPTMDVRCESMSVSISLLPPQIEQPQDVSV